MSEDRFSTLMAVITPDIIGKIMDKYGLDEDRAMAAFHKSELYKALEKEETKVWQYSADKLFDLYQQEIETGHIDLPEC